MCVDDGGQDACVYNVLVRMSTLYIGSQELVPILKSLLMLIMWCCCWCVDVCVVYWEVTEVDVVIYCLYVNIWRPIPIVFVDVIVLLLLNCVDVDVDVYVLRWQVRANTNYWDDSSIPSSAREKTQRSKTDSHFLSMMRDLHNFQTFLAQQNQNSSCQRFLS